MKRFLLALCLVLSLITVFVPEANAQATPPALEYVRFVLLVKTGAKTEANVRIKYTESAARNGLTLILDTLSPDIRSIKLATDANGQNMTCTDKGPATQSGAFHNIECKFPFTTVVGKQYQIDLGYGSRLNTYPFPTKDGKVEFNWTFNPLGTKVDLYEAYWVANEGTLKPTDTALVQGKFADWDSNEVVESQKTVYSKLNPMLAIKLTKKNAPANWTPVVGLIVPAAAFGVKETAPQQVATSLPPTAVQTQLTQAVQEPKPTIAPATSTTSSSGSSNWLGSLCVGLIVLGCLVGLGWLVISMMRPSKKTVDYSPSADSDPEPPVAPSRRRPAAFYETPAVKAETGYRRANPKPKKVVDEDLTLAQVASLLGKSPQKILISIVREMEEMGVLKVVEREPLKAKIVKTKFAAADAEGKIRSYHQALADALADDGQIDSRERRKIIAALEATLENHLTDKQSDRKATMAYYEEKIERLEREVASKRNPVTYVNNNSDIWFWLWLSDRNSYRDTRYSNGSTYCYPDTTNTGRIHGTEVKPLDETASWQKPADFGQKDTTSLWGQITGAASDAATGLTGSAAGSDDEPAKARPHDACVVSSHSDCVSAPHSDCVSHSDCVHSDCVSTPD